VRDNWRGQVDDCVCVCVCACVCVCMHKCTHMHARTHAHIFHTYMTKYKSIIHTQHVVCVTTEADKLTINSDYSLKATLLHVLALGCATYSNAWHDFFRCVIWLLQICDMLFQICDMTLGLLVHVLAVKNDTLFKCVTQLVQMGNMTPSDVWHTFSDVCHNSRRTGAC